MRLRFRRTAVVLAILGGTWVFAGAAPLFLRMVHSEPCTVNQVDFRAATQDTWHNPPVGEDKVDIRLEITNLSDTALLFPTFDTFQPTLQTADGKDVPIGGGRNGTLRGAIPVLVAPHETYALCRPAHLYWTDEGKVRRLRYIDGTGMQYSYGPLPAAKYSLRFSYKNDAQQDIDGHACWIGDAKTEKVEFEIGP